MVVVLLEKAHRLPLSRDQVEILIVNRNVVV